MKTSLLSSLVSLKVSLLPFLLVSPVSAYLGQPIEIEQKVGARSTEQTGVTVKAKREKGGAVAFTVTRYIPKGQPVLSNTLLVIPIAPDAPAVPMAPKAVVAPDTVVTTGPLPTPDVVAAPGRIMFTRTATLEVRSAKSLLCNTQVAAQSHLATDKEIVTYQFSLSPECLDHSTFSLNESIFTLPDKAQENNIFIGGGSHLRFIFNLAEIAEESFKIHTPW